MVTGVTVKMLRLKNIFKKFNKGTVNERQILNGLSLHIYPEEFVTVIGGNGSGKSTTLNIVAGVTPVDGGSVILDGEDITNQPEHIRARVIGRVFQDPMRGTAGNMRIFENLALAARRGKPRGLSWGVKKSEYGEYSKILKSFELGLETRLEMKVGLLSGGQRQALTLIMATLKKPKLLLLDEHTAALDPRTALKTLQQTERIVKENKITTLMITHNMKDAINYGDRLIMLDKGKIVLDISGEEKKNLKPEELVERFGMEI